MVSDKHSSVLFLPGERRVSVASGTSFIETAARAGFIINTPCGGAGKCGKCRVRFEAGAPAPNAAEVALIPAGELEQGWRLACQSHITQDALVHLPSDALFGGRHQIRTDSAADKSREVESDIRQAYLQMAPPSLRDDRPDMLRIEDALGGIFPRVDQDRPLHASHELMRGMGTLLRQEAFAGTATLRNDRLIEFESGDTTGQAFALAFDIGTTTLAGALLHIESGVERAVVSAMNPQAAYGDDVLSRIAYAARSETALQEIRHCLLDALRDMVGQLCRESAVAPRAIYEVALAGNTTMQHLLCGFNPASLGMAPFVPLHGRGLVLDAAELSLAIHPEAQAYVFPVIGGFVGGDTVAGLLAVEAGSLDGPVLMVDIGTNGEVVLLHEGRLLAASTAAGPAFEGARISCGMRAADGAIEKVAMNHDLALGVIGDAAPRGLCGSGLIDLCGGLLKCGLLRHDGRLKSDGELGADIPDALRKRLQFSAQGEPEFLLHESQVGRVVLTQRDVRELQLGAGAIRAGIQILLKQEGLVPGDLKQILIAGGFGSFIRRSNAQRIGLIPPELPHEKIRFAGNIAFSGAKWAALSRSARKEAEALANRARHVELSQDPDFALEFAMAMNFPDLP